MSYAENIVERVKDMYSVQRVYGDPIEKDGVTIITAAAVRGGAGGGVGFSGPASQTEADEVVGEGSGGGFGVDARPVGAWVVRADSVEWRPVVDVTRLVMGGLITIVLTTVIAAVFGHHGRD